jgi:phosphotransferase system HPr (HPr) family protein
MPASSSDPSGLPADEAIVVTANLPADVALHARPAADLVRAAGRLQAQVTIAANGKRANARSILDVLGLGAVGGTELTITATGPGAAEAAASLAQSVADLT